MVVDNELLLRVREAPTRTVAARTARVLHGIRIGSAEGELARTERSHPGVVDFERRLVSYASTIVVGRSEYPGETLWEGPNLYSRDAEPQEWRQVPVFRPPRGRMPFGAPLWLLNTLCGTAETAIVGEEQVRGIATTRIRASVDRDAAGGCSPCDLDFPPQPADAFPAEVWLDEEGRIQRMGCTWPIAPRGVFWRAVEQIENKLSPRQLAWITTEFWDFGADVVIPTPPSALHP
jgi:hypothetical protein